METSEEKPILYPLKRMLYSRKVMLALIALAITALGELGMPQEVIDFVQQAFVWIMSGWVAKDTAANFANGKNGK